MHIVLAGDHSSLELRAYIAAHLGELGYSYTDLGTHSTQSTDYPLWGAAAAKVIASGEADLGIVICGTGIGISLAANSVKGIRCANCSEPYSAKMAREHNNAQMLALGARTIGPDLALTIVDAFLTSVFTPNERHARRVEELETLDAGGELPSPC
ncbi:MAG: ribose 5-phosphate isomerase B [Propionibacteriaceae bacterium]|jgi:ribose 5-phosphate isomerase B|nr:ribose 5-phosphate isomerase B [Propionibacteriaceae bacterium]